MPHTQPVPQGELFLLHTFISFYYFSDLLAIVSGWFLCLLMSILFGLFWIRTGLLNEIYGRVFPQQTYSVWVVFM